VFNGMQQQEAGSNCVNAIIFWYGFNIMTMEAMLKQLYLTSDTAYYGRVATNTVFKRAMNQCWDNLLVDINAKCGFWMVLITLKS
jgi:hypothetical protein